MSLSRLVFGAGCGIQLYRFLIITLLSTFNKYLSHVMRKTVLAICEQQSCRSACASAQSDQHLCCSLPRYCNRSSFYMRNLKPPPSFCSCAGRFVSYLVGNPEDRFSHDEAHLSSASETAFEGLMMISQ